MRWNSFLGLGVFVLWSCHGPTQPHGDASVNLVLFVVDDLGWQDSSVAFGGVPGVFQEHFRTPHLAELAGRGLRFSDAHAQCVCTPTRLSMLTGLNSARHGCTNWVLHADGETSGQTDVLGPPPRWNRTGWQPGMATLPEALRAHGYRTIHTGKGHFGAIGTEGADPLNLGFDVNHAGHAAGAPGSYQGENGYDRKEAESPSVWAVPGLEAFRGRDVHLTDALTELALGSVEEAVAEGRPFFLHMAHYAVHTPIEPHAPWVEAYRARGLDEAEARYASMVEGVDASLGALLAKLDELGVAERTLIVFTSDNGGLTVHARGASATGGGPNTHNEPLREGKGSAYEGGTRIPLLFSWARSAPETRVQARLPIPSGRITDQTSLCEDLFPTLLAIAGAREVGGIDGLDLSPVLCGRGVLPERAFVFHSPHVWGPKGDGYQPHSSIRRGDWKAIYFYEPERWELYDLARDLSERDDRAQDRPEVLLDLAAELDQRLRSLDAAWPLEKSSGQERPLRMPTPKSSPRPPDSHSRGDRGPGGSEGERLSVPAAAGMERARVRGVVKPAGSCADSSP